MNVYQSNKYNYNDYTTTKLYFDYKLYDNNDEINKKIKNGKVRMKGGIIADDVGLGKTLTTISYLISKRDEDRLSVSNGNADLSTIIILPNRLVAQWDYEIKNYLKDKKYFNIMKLVH